MAMVRMTLMDYFRMTLIDFYLERMKMVVAVDVDHCIHQTLAGTAYVKTRLKMTEIVVMMFDLPAEYVVAERAVIMVSIVAV